MKFHQICPENSVKDADFNLKNFIPKFKLEMPETASQTDRPTSKNP